MAWSSQRPNATRSGITVATLYSPTVPCPRAVARTVSRPGMRAPRRTSRGSAPRTRAVAASSARSSAGLVSVRDTGSQPRDCARCSPNISAHSAVSPPANQAGCGRPAASMQARAEGAPAPQARPRWVPAAATMPAPATTASTAAPRHRRAPWRSHCSSSLAAVVAAAAAAKLAAIRAVSLAAGTLPDSTTTTTGRLTASCDNSAAVQVSVRSDRLPAPWSARPARAPRAAATPSRAASSNRTVLRAIIGLRGDKENARRQTRRGANLASWHLAVAV
ncbi:hypothetical protein D9M72_270100 [compost metagenome]